MCAEGHRPICQDTGIVTVFLKVGMDVHFNGTLAWKRWSTRVFAALTCCRRTSCAPPCSPIRRASARTRSDNTPAVVCVSIVPGNKLDVIVAAKGGGSEAKTKFAMLNPSDSIVEWVLKTVPTMGAGWCPPGIIGLGIGGTAEKAMLIAKEALMEPIDIQDLKARGAKNRAEELRLELYDKINALGIGAQGLGGLTTVLDVKVKDYPTHAANLPVAMIPNCAATRHAHFTLDGSGAVTLQPPSLKDWPELTYSPAYARRVNLDTVTREEVSVVEVRRGDSAQRKVADRPRRRAQAHDRNAESRREAASGLHQSLHLLRRPGRPGARRSCRTCRSHDLDAHG